MKLSSFNQMVLDAVPDTASRESYESYFREMCPKCNHPKGEHEWDDLGKDYRCIGADNVEYKA